MNLIIYTKDDYAERVQIECNTVEWLILNKALRQFMGNEENHKTDRKIAGEMCQKEPIFVKMEG